MPETEMTEQEAVDLPDETEPKPDDHETHDADDIESLIGDEVDDNTEADE